ncbi:MAG: hypothetical protein ABSF26_23490 [Thermoguttaceae bacterium]|jgi:hypothetical protein
MRVAVALLFLSVAGTALGDTLTINNFAPVTVGYSSQYPTRAFPYNLGPEPWLTAIFTSGGSLPANTVDLALTTANWVVTANTGYSLPPHGLGVNLWAFNVLENSTTKLTDARQLAITYLSGGPPNSPIQYDQGIDSGGTFGIVFKWGNDANGVPVFKAGETDFFQIKLSGAPSGATLTASDFQALSGGGYDGQMYSEAIIADGSEDYVASTPPSPLSIPVPEPTGIVALLGLAGMGLIGLVWRRRAAA